MNYQSMRLRRSSITPEDEAKLFLKEKRDKDGFVVRDTFKKGRGVFTTKPFKRGHFLMVYSGELVPGDEGERREEEEGESGFRYFFTYRGNDWCIDATMEPQGDDVMLGRLVNHGTKRERNAKIRPVEFEGSPALCIFALRDLETNEEVLYDYGVPEKDLPWNKEEVQVQLCTNLEHVSEYSRHDPSKSAMVTEKSTGPDSTTLVPDMKAANEDMCNKDENITSEKLGDDSKVVSVNDPGSLSLCEESHRNGDSVCVSKKDDNSVPNPKASDSGAVFNQTPNIEAPKTNRCDTDEEEALEKSVDDTGNDTLESAHPVTISIFEESGSDNDYISDSEKSDTIIPNFETSDSEAACIPHPVPDMKAAKTNVCNKDEIITSEISGDDSETVSVNVPDCISVCDGDLDSVSEKLPYSETSNSGAVLKGTIDVEAVQTIMCNTDIPETLEKTADNIENVSKESPDPVTISDFEESGNNGDDMSDTIVPDSETSDSEVVYSSIPIPDMRAARAAMTAKRKQCNNNVEGTSHFIPNRCEDDAETVLKESKSPHHFSACSDSSSDCGSVSDENDHDFVPDSEESDSDDECSPNLFHGKRAVKNQQNVKDMKKASDSDVHNSRVSGITVMPTSNESGKRNWDKPHYSPFCLTPQKKLPRHLQSIHKDEVKVQRWLATKDKQERATQMTMMRNYGNYLHNDSVIREGKGVLIVIYRPSYTVKPEDYLPCSECFGYYAKDDMWKHKCTKRKSIEQSEDEEDCPQQKKRRLAHCKPSRMLLPPIPGVSMRTHEIMTSMNMDAVSLYCKSDSLIKLYAEKMTERHGHDSDLNGYIRQKIREVGRMVLEYRSLTGDASTQLTDILCPKNFGNAIHATKITAGFDEDTNLYKTPSLALKIGHGLKTCTEILRGKALVDGDEALVQQCKGFLELYELHWEDKISHHALRTLKEGRRNNPRLLPLTEDVVKMTKYLQMQVKERQEDLQRMVCANESGKVTASWIKLAEVLLAQIIVFNRKRPGEVSKMTLEDYRKCASGEDAIIDSALSKWEVALCKCLWRVEIVGKGCNTVVVLLTAKMKEAMDTLVENREAAGIHSNHFMFSNQSGNGHLRACDTIREHSKLCKAKHPENLRATKLRKHIATVSQIMNLQENELDILAKFLGHDVRTHRQYYRLPDSTIQVAKVSKVLLKMERGDLKGLAGKSLEDIELDPSEECPSDGENSDTGSNFSDNEEPASAAITFSANNPGPSTVECKTVDHGQKGNKQQAKKPWTMPQKAAVAKHFRKHLLSRKLPGKAQIEALFKAEPNIFENRSWRNVKDFVRNQIRKKNPMSFLNS